MKRMTRVWMACLLAAVLALAASGALAETKITVSGTGETQVRADTAVISLGVNARDRDVLQAQKKVNGAIAAIRAALVARGVPEEDINTDYMNIYAVYDYENDREQVKAYDASSVLAVRVTDMDSVGRLIDADELIRYLNEWISDPVALSGFTRIINHQPTIIEAEVSEE